MNSGKVWVFDKNTSNNNLSSIDYEEFRKHFKLLLRAEKIKKIMNG
jgi:hypothetical protein